MKKIHIIGGGTFTHVRSHLALAAPAFGTTAKDIYTVLNSRFLNTDTEVLLHLTKMADSNSNIVTNDDVASLIDQIVADPDSRAIIMSAALCDYDGMVEGWQRCDPQPSWARKPMQQKGPVASGKYAPRLKTSEGVQNMVLTPADKLIGRIRKERKDIFVVGFKTTSDASSDEQYVAGLNLLKKNSINLVLANDIVTRNNMVIAPEETRYYETTNRGDAILGLLKIFGARLDNTFTRSTVKEGNLYRFQTDLHIPDNLRQVVNYCVEHGAYKPVNGATAGHFAVRKDENTVLTSRRKTNYNEPGGLDLVEVEYDGLDKVIAYGAKPSVGGQSQRIVFDEHPDLDCIVHFHCPLRADAPTKIPVAPQWINECGSHQCGQNTSRNLQQVIPDGLDPSQVQTPVFAVMLDGHGPNIVFSKRTPAEKIIAFIDAHFDLSKKTGGLVEPVKELELA